MRTRRFEAARRPEQSGERLLKHADERDHHASDHGFWVRIMSSSPRMVRSLRARQRFRSALLQEPLYGAPLRPNGCQAKLLRARTGDHDHIDARRESNRTTFESTRGIGV